MEASPRPRRQDFLDVSLRFVGDVLDCRLAYPENEGDAQGAPRVHGDVEAGGRECFQRLGRVAEVPRPFLTVLVTASQAAASSSPYGSAGPTTGLWTAGPRG